MFSPLGGVLADHKYLEKAVCQKGGGFGHGENTKGNRKAEYVHGIPEKLMMFYSFFLLSSWLQSVSW